MADSTLVGMGLKQHPGDVSLSTLLTVLALVGMLIASVV